MAFLDGLNSGAEFFWTAVAISVAGGLVWLLVPDPKESVGKALRTIPAMSTHLLTSLVVGLLVGIDYGIQQINPLGSTAMATAMFANGYFSTDALRALLRRRQSRKGEE